MYGQEGQTDAGRAGTHLVAAVLIKYNQKDGHDHDDTYHDEGVKHGVEEALAHRRCIFREWRVDAEEEGQVSTTTLLWVPPTPREPWTASGGALGTPAWRSAAHYPPELPCLPTHVLAP